MTSDEGCDEFSPRRRTHLTWWVSALTGTRSLDPLKLLPAEDRRGAWGPMEPTAAASEAERILAGGGGARRGSVLLTSGAALWTAGRVASIEKGVEYATEVLDGGAPERLLAELRVLGRPFLRAPES